MYHILRNNQQFGPYDEQMILNYVNSGQILLCDVTKDINTDEVSTVRKVLKKASLKPTIPHAGDIISQIRKIGTELIVPKSAIFNKQWLKNVQLLVLALVGLTPSVLLMFPIGGFAVFYLVALDFSAIWGLFFYYLFRTPQVRMKTTILVFFLTQIFVFFLWDVLGMVSINPFYNLLNLSFPFNGLGYILGVGLTEELVKALPLFIIAWKATQPLVPKTLVYYGLMSGIAFGVYEGVGYQMQVNVELDYTSAFFMNIARLTSLPFLHAIWCGIAGYFVAFAKLYPKFRLSLYFLAVAIPAILHGVYDTFCGSRPGLIVAIPIMFIGVCLLMTYLKHSFYDQSILRS